MITVLVRYLIHRTDVCVSLGIPYCRKYCKNWVVKGLRSRASAKCRWHPYRTTGLVNILIAERTPNAFVRLTAVGTSERSLSLCSEILVMPGMLYRMLGAPNSLHSTYRLDTQRRSLEPIPDLNSLHFPV